MKPRAIESLVGMRFGTLEVLSLQRTGTGRLAWLCRCGCGRELLVRRWELLCRKQRGCLSCLTKHGEGPRGNLTAEYRAWRAMWNRCTNPNYSLWRRYGGRGITVCERWKSYLSFLADMGRRPTSAHSLDRRDNSGSYEPSNCRWATTTEQNRNRAHLKRYAFAGEMLLLSEISERTGIRVGTLWWRVRNGVPLERPLTAAVSQ